MATSDLERMLDDWAMARSSNDPERVLALHFEGRVTGDIYVVETGADGGFSADLPGGDYDLTGC